MTSKLLSSDVYVKSKQQYEVCIRPCVVQVSKAALELFAFGQAEAAQRGLLLVDTKYEFGKDADGNILLVDEVRLRPKA